jgi:hypothetical protein
VISLFRPEEVDYYGVIYVLGRGDLLLLPAVVGACVYQGRGVVTLLEIVVPDSAVEFQSGSTSQIEDYKFDLDRVWMFQLVIDPDIAKGSVVASLVSWRLGQLEFRLVRILWTGQV